MHESNALPHGTPAAVVASVTGSTVAEYAHSLTDIHELATVITVVAGSLSIVISVITLVALLSHYIVKKQ